MSVSLAAVMRIINEKHQIKLPELPQLRQKAIQVAHEHGLEPGDVAHDILLMLDEGYTVAAILALEFEYED
jgi:prolyl-tRNA editing enzyme YbaK/EbsC (Cys-tRNA(Pro) deacylase)